MTAQSAPQPSGLLDLPFKRVKLPCLLELEVLLEIVVRCHTCDL